MWLKVCGDLSEGRVTGRVPVPMSSCSHHSLSLYFKFVPKLDVVT